MVLRTLAIATLVAACFGFEPVAAQQAEWDYRLNGGTSWGRLEARVGGARGKWGSVCQRNFTAAAAAAACRSLRMDDRTVAFRHIEPSCESGSSPFLIAAVNCLGNETYPHQCPWVNSTVAPGCTSYDQVVLTCGANTTYQYRLSDGEAHYGRLDVRVNSELKWGLVCRSRFTAANAAVVCSSLGHRRTGAVFRVVIASETNPVISYPGMTVRACTGNESSLDKCPVGVDATSVTCDYLQAVLITCMPVTATTASSFQFRIRGGNDRWGRLETRAGPMSSWGTVSLPSGRSTAELASFATVACRTLQLNSQITFARRARNSYEYGSGDMAITLDLPNCTGAEESLRDCDFPVEVTGTSHSADVIVVCGATTTAEFALAGGGSNWGTFQMRLSSNEPWNYLCGRWFHALNGQIACRSLGFTPAANAYYWSDPTNWQRSTLSSLFSYLNCTPSTINSPPPWTFDLCPTDTMYMAVRDDSAARYYCQNINNERRSDLILMCEEPRSQWDYRLSSGFWGRLEARPIVADRVPDDKHWGTVAYSASPAVALVACRSVGQASTRADSRNGITPGTRSPCGSSTSAVTVPRQSSRIASAFRTRPTLPTVATSPSFAGQNRCGSIG
jgi:hypothetical protein